MTGNQMRAEEAQEHFLRPQLRHGNWNVNVCSANVCHTAKPSLVLFQLKYAYPVIVNKSRTVCRLTKRSNQIMSWMHLSLRGDSVCFGTDLKMNGTFP